jgi:hypothetical protein
MAGYTAPMPVQFILPKKFPTAALPLGRNDREAEKIRDGRQQFNHRSNQFDDFLSLDGRGLR